MAQHSFGEQGQQLTLLLEIAPEDERDPDPIAVREVGQSIKDSLMQDGYAVEPVYTGHRGDVDIVLQTAIILQTLGGDIYAQKEVIGIVANLFTIFVPILPLAQSIFKGRAKQATQNGTPQPIKITVSIDGAPITVEADDLQKAEAALELAKRFHSTHPTVAVVPQSQIKISTPVPKKQQRRRR
jgi:hypothetical protein